MPETFTLADFLREEWANHPPYSAYSGVGIDHLDALHAAASGLVAREIIGERNHVAYAHLEALSFCIWTYEVNAWMTDGAILSADPCFLILGTTFDGVREVQPCPVMSAHPHGIIEQMQWVVAYLDEKGWVATARQPA